MSALESAGVSAVRNNRGSEEQDKGHKIYEARTGRKAGVS